MLIMNILTGVFFSVIYRLFGPAENVLYKNKKKLYIK